MVTEGECSLRSVSVQSHRQLLLQTGWLYAWRWKSPGSCPTHYWFSSCPRWKCLWNFKDASGAFNPLRAAVLFWDRHSWARAVIAKMGLIVYFPCDCMNLHSSQIWCELRCLRNTALSAVFYYYTTSCVRWQDEVKRSHRVCCSCSSLNHLPISCSKQQGGSHLALVCFGLPGRHLWMWGNV